MKTLFLTTGQGKSTSLLRCLRNTFADCHVEKGRLGSLNRIKAYPELTVVQVDYQTEPSDIEAMIPQLANLQDRFPQGSFVMFGIDRSQETPPSKTKASQEERFHAIFSCIRHYVAKFLSPNSTHYELANVWEPQQRSIVCSSEDGNTTTDNTVYNTNGFFISKYVFFSKRFYSFFKKIS